MNAESYQVLARSTIAKQNYFQNQPHITISLNADIQTGALAILMIHCELSIRNSNNGTFSPILEEFQGLFLST
jgi:hypothetical protein